MTANPYVADWPRALQVDLGGGRVIACVDLPGGGIPLVLLHGFTDFGLSYAPLVPHLAGHRLIIPDLRGHGGSFRGDAYQMADFSSDIAALLAKLDIDRAILVGHSLGSMVAINLAASWEGRVQGLVTLAGTLRPQGPAIEALATSIARLVDPIDPEDPFFDGWHSCADKQGDDFPRRLKNNACAMPAAIWQAIFAAIRAVDLTLAARKIWAPTLVIGGACDPLFGPDHHAALLSAFSHARGSSLADCGHNPHWQQPKTVAALIRNFVTTQVQAV